MSWRDQHAQPNPDGAVVALLAVDRQLGRTLDPARARIAQRRLLVRVRRFPKGSAALDRGSGVSGDAGWLVIDGFALHHVSLGRDAAAELLGPGDLLRPGPRPADAEDGPFAAHFEPLGSLAVAVLDDALVAALAPFPELTAALVGRASARCQRAAAQLVLTQLASVKDRVLLCLWQLADRWGHPDLDGTAVPIPLTHETLGLLVGAGRQSVTAALCALDREGAVFRSRSRGYRLVVRPTEVPPVRGGAGPIRLREPRTQPLGARMERRGCRPVRRMTR